MDPATPGAVVLAGTPIGDVADASPRLRTELETCSVIAAEDTRRLRALTERLGVRIAGRVVSYFEGNEAERTPELIARVRAGDRVLLVTDAGMPSVSDPGYRLVAAAVDEGLAVTAVPGPSAVLTALAVSGLPVDRFCFEGFLPRRSGERRERLSELIAEPRTAVLFEAPHRLADLLADAVEVLGATRRAAVCRELTKTYEEVRRGTLAELAAWAADGVRGEITVVLAPPEQRDIGADALAEVLARVSAGERLSGAVAEVAKATGVRRNRLYAEALAATEARR